MKTKQYMLGLCALGLFATVNINQSIKAQDTVQALDEVFIRDSRVNDKSPLTTTTINRSALMEQKTETALPYIIELQPSVVAASENCQAGNTSLRIRGVDAARINVNINGVTLNDPESQTVYWVNIPNLAGMSQSVQIQRGIAASTGGSADFGAAINLQTLGTASQPYGIADISYGSWNTRQYSISAGTGQTKHGFSFDMNYTGLTTDGYIRNGFSDQQSIFLNGGYYGEKTIVKGIVIIGKQRTGITWNGAYETELDADPKYNASGFMFGDASGKKFYYDDETDNYKQQHYQLYINQMLSDRWSLNAALDYTHGFGFDNNYLADYDPSFYNLLVNNTLGATTNLLVTPTMKNDAYTAKVGARYNGDKVNVSVGESFLMFYGHQYGNVSWSSQSNTSYLDNNTGNYVAIDLNETPYEWYSYESNKIDATTFVKFNWDITEDVNLYADIQNRYVFYKVDGIVEDLNGLNHKANYNFFNPRAGINWNIDSHNRTYFMMGISHREPTLSDIKNTNASGDTIKPEAMYDFEIGYRFSNSRFSASANVYAMLYKDQLAPSGVIDNLGYALMENVEQSYRLGIELEAGYRFCKWFKLDGNITLSRNKIIDYTYGEFEDGVSTTEEYHVANTDLSYSPSVVGAALATFEPVKDLKLQITGKYVGEMYGDNTSRDVYKQKAYFLLNCRIGYTFHLGGTREIEAQIAARNILNNQYRLLAWVGDWQDYDTGVFYHSKAYYQQPGINFTGRLIFRF